MPVIRTVFLMLAIYLAAYGAARWQGAVRILDLGVYACPIQKPEWRAKPFAAVEGKGDVWESRLAWARCKFEDGLYYLFYPAAKLECHVRNKS